MPGATDQIMLCGVSITFQSGFLAKILELGELGFEVRSVDASYSGSTWAEVLYSCIKRLKPMRLTIAFQPSKSWKTVAEAAPETVTITWPTPDGFEDGGTVSFMAKCTDWTARGGNEERVTATIVLTPSGAPTLVLAEAS